MRLIDIDPILAWANDPEVYEPYGVRGSELERKLWDAPIIETKDIKYYDESENVWKIGRVIVDEID